MPSEERWGSTPSEATPVPVVADLAHIAEPLRPLAVPCTALSLDPANARHAGPNLEATPVTDPRPSSG